MHNYNQKKIYNTEEEEEMNVNCREPDWCQNKAHPNKFQKGLYKRDVNG